ncbi:hypothetical protein E5Q_00260 [Mixia osmundae IAM 14324]|uniref:Uncharacterized protein n=1 Tax=Mixia osmundae (strain CBS 9802 / IAM 14324 / JCM 22182 / KY 12970) TaxID=764103 RepID=G7DSQ8_MIXOS|nr:hypothetical protein E5Q_00260 [Mixia osmundae IAM 14324]
MLTCPFAGLQTYNKLSSRVSCGQPFPQTSGSLGAAPISGEQISL